MSEIERLYQAINEVRNPDNKVQQNILAYFDDFRSNDLMGFVNGIYQIIQQDQSPIVLLTGLTLLLQPYHSAVKALKVVKNGDTTKEHLIIPPDFSVQFLKQLINLFSAQDISIRNVSENLYASACSLLIQQEIQENPLDLLLQSAVSPEIPEEIRISCLKSLAEFFTLSDYDPGLTHSVVAGLFPILESGPSVGIVSACIDVFINITEYFETIFQSPQNPEFVQLLTALINFTQNENLVAKSLTFWLSLCTRWYSWLTIASQLVDFIITLIPSDDSEISELAINIIQEIGLADIEAEEKDCLNIVTGKFQALFEPLMAKSLTIDCDTTNTNENFDSALECLLNLLQAPQILEGAFSALWGFCSNGIQSDEVNCEVALRIMTQLVILQASPDILSDCLEAAVQFCDCENQRVQLAAINLFTSIITATSDAGLADNLSDEILNLTLSECADIYSAAAELILAFCSLEGFQLHAETFAALFDRGTVGSLNAACAVLSKYGTPQMSGPYLAKAIALASNAIDAKDESLSGVAIQIAKDCLMNVYPNGREFSVPLFKYAQKGYTMFELPEAITAMAACAYVEGGTMLLPTAMGTIMNYLGEFAERERQSAAISAISVYIAKTEASLEGYIANICSKLLQTLASVDSMPESKPEALDAMNALFKYSHREQTMLFFSRFVAIVFSAIQVIDTIEQDDKQLADLGAALADSMITIIEIEPSEDTVGASLAILRFNISREAISERLAIDTLKLVECLINMNLENTKAAFAESKLGEFLQGIIDLSPRQEILELTVSIAGALEIEIQMPEQEE